MRIESRLPVIAALSDVLWKTWQVDSGGAGHVMSFLFEGGHFAAHAMQ